MPYFTDEENGQIRAVYSGRFAFIRPDTYDNIKENFKRATESVDVGGVGGAENENFSSLQEEFGHSIQFSKMPIGNALNGVRWMIRQFFIYFPYEWPVAAYYKIRILWFCLNYNMLEEMYGEHEKSPQKNKKFPVSFAKLFVQDVKSGFIIFKCLPIPILLLMISSPVTIPIGVILNFHFTVHVLKIEKNDESKEITKKEIIEHGLTAYTTSLAEKNGFSSFMRGFIVIVQHQYMMSRRPWLVRKWVHIKFKTEKLMFDKQIIKNNKIPAFQDFDGYIEKIGSFAVRWATGDIGLMDGMKIVDALEGVTYKFDEHVDVALEARLINVWSDTLNFFYMHGN